VKIILRLELETVFTLVLVDYRTRSESILREHLGDFGHILPSCRETSSGGTSWPCSNHPMSTMAKDASCMVRVKDMLNLCHGKQGQQAQTRTSELSGTLQTDKTGTVGSNQLAWR
jgi:hypothetical protein